MDSSPIPKISYPFFGNYPVTLIFGAHAPTLAVQKKFTEWGIVGHNGIDFGLPEGTNVLSVDGGVVFRAGLRGDLGITIILSHSWGKSLYAYLKSSVVTEGAPVTRGQLLGTSGHTGTVLAPHM